jgi:hypothetical protein
VGTDEGGLVDRVDVYRVVAPFIAAGTVFVAIKAIRVGYESATGSKPPRPDDLEVSTTRVIAFTVLTAAASAVIHAGITRSVAVAARRHQQEHVGDIVTA